MSKTLSEQIEALEYMANVYSQHPDPEKRQRVISLRTAAETLRGLQRNQRQAEPYRDLTAGHWAAEPRVHEPERPFPTVKEIEEWFDKTHCDMGGVVVTWAPDLDPAMTQTRAKVISDAAVSPKTRKLRWLRADNNEAWYGVRIALVHSVWHELKASHDWVVNKQAKQIEELSVKLAKLTTDYDLLEKDREREIVYSERLQMKLGRLHTKLKVMLASIRDLDPGFSPKSSGIKRKVIALMRALIDSPELKPLEKEEV